MSYFYATILNKDGTPAAVEMCSAVTENAAAHIAVRLANRLHEDIAVVQMTNDGPKVVQTVRYRGEEIPEPKRKEAVIATIGSKVDRHYLSGVSLTKNTTRINGFCLRYVTMGYTVTITQDRTKDSATYVNVVASKTL